MTVKKLYHITAAGPARFIISGKGYNLSPGETRGPFTEAEVAQAKRSSDRDRLYFTSYTSAASVKEVAKHDDQSSYKVEQTVESITNDVLKQETETLVDLAPNDYIEASSAVLLENAGPTIGQTVEDIVPLDTRTSYVESVEYAGEPVFEELAKEEVGTPEVVEKKPRRRKKVEEVEE